jgi:hypothetical protein
MAIMNWFAAEQLEILETSREAVYKEAVKRVGELFKDNPTGITSRDVARARISATGADANALLEKMREQRLLRREDILPPLNQGGKTKVVYHLV